MSIGNLNSYFQKNRKSIMKDHEKEYAVIYNDVVKGYFSSDDEALGFCAKEGYKLGTFLIKQCVEEEIQRFHSRASFA